MARRKHKVSVSRSLRKFRHSVDFETAEIVSSGETTDKGVMQAASVVTS